MHYAVSGSTRVVQSPATHDGPPIPETHDGTASSSPPWEREQCNFACIISYEISEVMKARPERIFPYLSSVELYPLWMAVKSAEPVTPEIEGRGMRWLSHLREGDFLIENHEFETNRMVGYKTIEGPFGWVGGFRLDPVGPDETRVTSYGQVSLTGFRRLLEWLFAGQVRKGEAAELTKLKALVETNPG